MWINNGSKTPVRIVPYGYGRRDDEGDAIAALVRAEASAADDRRSETRDDFTADALAALAKLDDHGQDQIPLMLEFGEALAKAKAALKHGEFSPWCRDVLKRSPSWCSSHRRLFEGRADLEPALVWAAATDHKWVSCRSIERLLKLLADYKDVTHGDSATVRRARTRSKPITLRAAKRRIAALHTALEEARADFIALRDQLPTEVAAKAAELSALATADDVAAKDELAALARRYH